MKYFYDILVYLVYFFRTGGLYAVFSHVKKKMHGMECSRKLRDGCSNVS